MAKTPAPSVHASPTGKSLKHHHDHEHHHHHSHYAHSDSGDSSASGATIREEHTRVVETDVKFKKGGEREKVTQAAAPEGKTSRPPSVVATVVEVKEKSRPPTVLVETVVEEAPPKVVSSKAKSIKAPTEKAPSRALTEEAAPPKLPNVKAASRPPSIKVASRAPSLVIENTVVADPIPLPAPPILPIPPSPKASVKSTKSHHSHHPEVVVNVNLGDLLHQAQAQATAQGSKVASPAASVKNLPSRVASRAPSIVAPTPLPEPDMQLPKIFKSSPSNQAEEPATRPDEGGDIVEQVTTTVTTRTIMPKGSTEVIPAVDLVQEVQSPPSEAKSKKGKGKGRAKDGVPATPEAPAAPAVPALPDESPTRVVETTTVETITFPITHSETVDTSATTVGNPTTMGYGGARNAGLAESSRISGTKGGIRPIPLVDYQALIQPTPPPKERPLLPPSTAAQAPYPAATVVAPAPTTVAPPQTIATITAEVERDAQGLEHIHAAVHDHTDDRERERESRKEKKKKDKEKRRRSKSRERIYRPLDAGLPPPKSERLVREQV
ncbi:hypothetical protein P7C73_g4783, partial [Tremellales sp. Uapishka_1]